jgi:Fe-S cluster assembly iron-binding protein IscA/plastocyanin
LCALRLSIKGSDVYGVKYVFSVDCNAPRQGDMVVALHGFRLYLDSDTHAYLSEISEVLRIDYVESAAYSGFRLSLPEKTITLVTAEKKGIRPSGVRLRSSFTVALLIVVLVAGLTMGWMGASRSVTIKSTAPTPATANVVNLDVIPDWGGPGYDAFIIPSAVNGTVPVSTAKGRPGPNNNTIFVPANAPVTFVITDTDTAINLNYSETAKLAFTTYNDSSTGQVPVHYSPGQLVEMPVSHTFVIAGTNVDVPLPPDTIVTFTTIFTSPGRYAYYCTAPCGPGMEVIGYMMGTLVAQ